MRSDFELLRTATRPYTTKITTRRAATPTAAAAPRAMPTMAPVESPSPPSQITSLFGDALPCIRAAFQLVASARLVICAL